MRTPEQTQALLIERIALFTGVTPNPDFVSINRHEGGVTMGLIDPESPAKLIGMNLAPASYSERLSDEALTYLVAHEYAAALAFRGLSDVEVAMSQALESCQSDEERIRTRSRFEIENGVIAIQLARKLHIDRAALAVLTERSLSTQGCLELMSAELEEWSKVKPPERACARKGFQLFRIQHSEYLLAGKELAADSLRREAERAASSFTKTPSLD